MEGEFLTEVGELRCRELSHGGMEDTEVAAQMQEARVGMEGMFLTKDMRGVFIGS